MTLSKRIAALEGPDRRIDATVWNLVDRPEPNDPDRNLYMFDRIVARIMAGGDDEECPLYTQSIDAALSIVEPSMQDYIMDEAMKRVDSRVVIIGKFNEQLARAICEVALEGKGL